jgi:two-component system, sensor histidine kinase and response regulator
VGSPKVLVIDDEEISRISCERILKRMSLEIAKAGGGREGLEILMRDPPDLVLVDLKMPEMDGMEVARRIRAYDPSIVTIIITGYATIETAVTAIKEGAYDYLPKPFTPDELVIVVHRGLEKRRLDRESRALREEKEAMERNFVTMVTHQLRSPLGAICQYFEVLLSDLAGGLSEMQREMIERARDRLEGLLGLINDWLDMNRVRAGDIVHRLQPCSLTLCVDEALAALEMAATEKGVQISVNIPSDLPQVTIDPDTFREVLSNLISNAIKYNRPEGRIGINAFEDNDWVVVAIEDTGFGLDEKEIPFLFEQFYRSKAKEVRQQQGTGLGLTIAQKIVQAHGGKIEVQSQPGGGSKFSVFINKARETVSRGH